MVVAMVSVRVVQVTIDQIVNVVAMRNRLVSAAGTMDMVGLMARAAVNGRAAIGILLAHLDDMLVDVIAMRMMQMAVVQVVNMIPMPNGDVAAVGAVLMVMIGVVGRLRFDIFFSLHGQCVSQAWATALSTKACRV